MPEQSLPDSSLHDIARSALGEVTPSENVGDDAGYVDVEPGVVTVYFENTLAGYPGWRWAVSIATLDGGEPSVLETDLIPAEGALLAPDWIPWSDRLADYKAAQELAGESETDADADDSEESDDSDDESDDSDDDETDEDDDESDDDDDDALGSDVVHGGDVDGVDIDSLDEDSEEH